jgi:nitrile hydratase subunit beta
MESMMNGGHDIGGMHGFGPIHPELEAEEEVFHAEWERRVFGLRLAVGALGKFNIDMARYARERQHPADYLRHAYYENWLAGLEKLLVETGLVTAEELATGKAVGVADEDIRKRVRKAEQVPVALAKGSPANMPLDVPPRFKSGDRVRAVNRHPTGHTREPRYVRGCVGVIHTHHGAHVFPERSAEGVREGQHLYCVRFETSALWGESDSTKSAVYVDLWEAYLERA